MTVIKIKNSNTGGKIPSTGDIQTAELALNLADKKLYSKDASGNIFEIGADTTGEVPGGGTGDRPGSPGVGELFYDTDLGALLYWDGNAWQQIPSETPGGGGDYVKLDDGGTKQVIKSGGLGISDGTDENITLNADGSGIFEGSVQAGNSYLNVSGFELLINDGTDNQVMYQAGSGLYIGNSGSNALVGTSKIRLLEDGDGTFAGEVTSGKAFNVGDGTVLYPQGLLGIRKDGATAGVIQVLKDGATSDNHETVSIKNTGDAFFGGSSVEVGAGYAKGGGLNLFVNDRGTDQERGAFVAKAVSTADKGAAAFQVSDSTTNTVEIDYSGAATFAGSVISGTFVQAGGINTGEASIGIGGNAITTSTAGVGPAPLTINTNTTIDHAGNATFGSQITAGSLTVDQPFGIVAYSNNSNVSQHATLLLRNANNTGRAIVVQHADTGNIAWQVSSVGVQTTRGVVIETEADNPANYTTTMVDGEQQQVYNGPTMDVKERLTKADETFQELLVAVQSATDFGELKAAMLVALEDYAA